jgi:hypothetical protein
MEFVIAGVVIVVFAAGLVVLGRGLKPTRPRPTSRYRGKTLLDVEHELKQARKHQRDGR